MTKTVICKVCDKEYSIPSKSKSWSKTCSQQCWKTAYNAYHRQYTKTKKNSQYRKNRMLKRKYGLTIEQYDEMKKRQSGLCAICKTDKPGGNGDLSVDHDHKTGKLRGLLCSRCNLGLGHFNDEVEVLKQAIEYLTFLRR